MANIELLSHGIFEKKFMDSKITSRTVTKKERILGHLVGPLGLIFVVNTIAALVEKFFTQQTGAMYGVDNIEMIQAMGGKYEVIMTVAKVLAVFAGLFTGWLMQHTKSRQGRMRPWHLLFGFISIIIGGLIFLFPGTTLGESYWYYFFFLLICYHTVGSTFFYTFRDNIVSISTRDSKEKTQLKFIRQVSWTLISGMIIGMLINMVVLPMWLEHDINGYAILLVVMSICAIPLLLLEYFYTKERIIEDLALEEGEGNENRIPVMDQIRALATNKYFVLLTLITLVGGIVDNFKGGNVQYFYIKFMLGGETDYFRYTLYQVVTGIPLGLGAIIIYPLARKLGIRNVAVGGYALVLIGAVVGWMFPSNLPIALAAGFLRQAGMLPNAYIVATLMCFAFDSIEYKSGYRLEGLMGTAIVSAILSLIYAPFAGGFEASILKLGFVDVAGITPSAEVKSFMTLAFYAFDVLLAVANLIILPFVDVEKHLPEINAELERRKKAAVLARGEEWVEPEEMERRENEKLAKEFEENRIADLKELCTRKGLDFETENAKYLAKQAEKEAKQAAKQARKGNKSV
ncbi:MAG: MFS transporter [Roseburia sp.]|nr:MFS transporter [Roseburia sp.]MCM1098973.1 MFS transporter [Ruminococcus flavefaciens]